MPSFLFCKRNDHQALAEKGEMLYGKFITYYGHDYNFQTLVLSHPKGTEEEGTGEPCLQQCWVVITEPEF